METLNLSEGTPRTESWVKRLFWPSVESGADVDYLGAQGFWVCFAVAVISFVFLIASGHPVVAIAALFFYYVGGMGVRERSRYAALVVFLGYAAEALLSIGVIRVLIGALLLSNVRAIWIASKWKPDSEEATAFPPRFNDTLGDKLADQWPAKLWPKLRIVYYIFAPLFALAEWFGAIAVRSGLVK